jgi:hypothetical protein
MPGGDNKQPLVVIDSEGPFDNRTTTEAADINRGARIKTDL